jgi:4-methyl-5(b-hydroxyethyl)-thiazole monophosphate biosynthesis
MAEAAKLTALVPVADGSEEIETVCIVDTFVRAGITVTLASASCQTTVKCSRGVMLNADTLIADCEAKEYDCIAVPGGMPGAKTIGEHEAFIAMLKKHKEAGKVYGAICAAPAVVLMPHGLLGEGSATSHPAFADKMKETIAERYSEERVVVDGKVVTSRGPGTAIEFALMLITLLAGAEKAEAVKGPMLVK